MPPLSYDFRGFIDDIDAITAILLCRSSDTREGPRLLVVLPKLPEEGKRSRVTIRTEPSWVNFMAFDTKLLTLHVSYVTE